MIDNKTIYCLFLPQQIKIRKAYPISSVARSNL